MTAADYQRRENLTKANHVFSGGLGLRRNFLQTVKQRLAVISSLFIALQVVRLNKLFFRTQDLAVATLHVDLDEPVPNF